MIVTIHQPCFFPYLGVLKKIAQSHVLVVLDDVQYTKGEYFERNRIKAPTGCKWFRVPLLYHFGDKLNEVAPNDAIDWRGRFMKTLEENYREAPYRRYIAGAHDVILRDYRTLAAVGFDSMMWILDLFRITPKVVISSDLSVESEGTARLIEICRRVGGTKYLSGSGGKAYLDERLFAQAGIEVEYAEFNSPEYPPQHGAPFIPNLSCLDYLFNCGPDLRIVPMS